MEKGDGCFFRTGFLETMSGATEHSVVVAKAEARQESRARLESMPVAVREEGSRRIVAGVRAQPIWREAKRVLLFAPIQLEPDVRGLCEVGMKEGKQICLPRWDGREYVAAWMKRGWADCVAGQFGILEPCSDGETLSLNPLDLVLVPGIAWTRCGLRLGRGRGITIGFWRQRAGFIAGWRLTNRLWRNFRSRRMTSGSSFCSPHRGAGVADPRKPIDVWIDHDDLGGMRLVRGGGLGCLGLELGARQATGA